jgi:hypothetical protein
MQSPTLIVAVAALTFGYVLLRFTRAMRAAGIRDRRLGQGGLVFALGVPLLLVVPRTPDIPNDDLQAILLGSALWVTIAMAFAAYAISHTAHRRTL